MHVGLGHENKRTKHSRCKQQSTEFRFPEKLKRSGKLLKSVLNVRIDIYVTFRNSSELNDFSLR